ncbi:MAG TPA: hypothetical protein VK689_04465 [Armatimonadota bacterium]|nr:hypothetical protein [Armatimonadota bacterium]
MRQYSQEPQEERLAELERLRAAEDLAAIREGLAQADRGEGRPAADVFAELKRKHGL